MTSAQEQTQRQLLHNEVEDVFDPNVRPLPVGLLPFYSLF